MSDYPVMRGSRSGDPHPRLRLAALTAVIAGVILVAVAAFLLSYAGIHQIALQAGVSPRLARLYPLMFDAMLVITGSAALALRSAGWWTRCYVWVSLLLLVGAVAAGDALHATGVSLTGQAARAAIAVIPWVLLLMGFGMWLVMLRQWRKIRTAGAVNGTANGQASQASSASQAGQASRTGQAAEDGAITAGSAAAAGGAVTWAAGRGAAPARTGAPRAGIDTLLERPAGQAPERPPGAEDPAAGNRAVAEDQGQQSRTATLDEHHPAGAGAAGAAAGTAAGIVAGTAAGARQDGGHGDDGRDRDGDGDADRAGSETAPGDGQHTPAGAMAEGGVTFEDLPAGPGGQYESATSEGGEPHEAGTQAGDDEHAAPTPTIPAPAPLPNFDRPRSTPTPPQETGASAE